MADMNSLMNSELYKPNSHKAKQEEKERPPKDIQKVVTGNVRSKDQPMAKKMAKSFLADDVSNVKSYIILDVLIPTIKEAISQIIKNGSDMLIFGDVKPSGTRGVRLPLFFHKRDCWGDRGDSPAARPLRCCGGLAVRERTSRRFAPARRCC